MHEARKHVKKIRAVLRLFRAGLGKRYDVENDQLRRIAHECHRSAMSKPSSKLREVFGTTTRLS